MAVNKSVGLCLLVTCKHNPMAEDGRILTILTPEEKEVFKRKAKAENRTLSNFVATILREWLAQNTD